MGCIQCKFFRKTRNLSTQIQELEYQLSQTNNPKLKHQIQMTLDNIQTVITQGEEVEGAKKSTTLLKMAKKHLKDMNPTKNLLKANQVADELKVLTEEIQDDLQEYNETLKPYPIDEFSSTEEDPLSIPDVPTNQIVNPRTPIHQTVNQKKLNSNQKV